MESFGAVVALEHPPLLAWVDRTWCRSHLGMQTHPRWSGPDSAVDPDAPLRAPNEVHLVLSRRCPARCAYCYVDADPQAPPALPLETQRETLRALARLEVFHVALGGGESLLEPALFPLAEEARANGLVPNLTTSGIGMTPALAERCRIFGQVNVSLDGLGLLHTSSRMGGRAGAVSETHPETHPVPPLEGRTDLALSAIGMLLAAGVQVGVNTVLTRDAWDGLDALCAFASSQGLVEVELLRLKPVGRAPNTYDQQRLSDAQHLALLPRVLALGERHRLNLKLDCSFAPMICAHAPPEALLKAFAVTGCDAGGSLGAILPDGRLAGCSFLPGGAAGEGPQVDVHWAQAPALELTRRYPERAVEPCRSCRYLSICRGGCRAVAGARVEGPGAFEAPDPECPRVLAWTSSKQLAPESDLCV